MMRSLLEPSKKDMHKAEVQRKGLVVKSPPAPTLNLKTPHHYGPPKPIEVYDKKQKAPRIEDMQASIWSSGACTNSGRSGLGAFAFGLPAVGAF